MKILILLFFGALKSRKLKYLETHLFKKNSAHRFEDHICTNKLEEFFCRKCFFQRLAAFFTTAKPLIWASFFPTKNQFHTFFKCDYLILMHYQKHALRISLKNDFTLLNKPLEPNKLP